MTTTLRVVPDAPQKRSDALTDPLTLRAHNLRPAIRAAYRRLDVDTVALGLMERHGTVGREMLNMTLIPSRCDRHRAAAVDQLCDLAATALELARRLQAGE